LQLHVLQSIYLINSPKVKAGAENVHFWYKYNHADVYAIHMVQAYVFTSFYLIRVINRIGFSLEKEDMHLAFHSVLIIYKNTFLSRCLFKFV